MIEARGLTKRYGMKTAVEDLSFQVRPGVVTGFLGPNGSGKSTTMRMILGLDAPTAGTATVCGRQYRSLSNAMRTVGALLDAKAVHGGRSGYRHLLSLAQLGGLPRQRVDEVLGIVGLGEVARQRSKGFSLGMGQRLGIAAALLGDPEVLLFDEPVNGLDPEGIRWIRNLMRALAAEGRTVFVSSHLMSEMALTADHLIIIGRGRLLADISVQDFIRQHSVGGSVRVRTRPEDTERLAGLLREAGGQAVPEPDGGLNVTGLDSERVGGAAFDGGVRLVELTPRQASLEEAYMRLTQHAVEYRATADPSGGGSGGSGGGPVGAAVPPPQQQQSQQSGPPMPPPPAPPAPWGPPQQAPVGGFAPGQGWANTGESGR